jgi:hypothetical protein
VDEEFTATDVSGRFAARVLEESVGEGVADRWPEETGLAGMEERPERPESDISVTQGRTPQKSGAWERIFVLIEAGLPPQLTQPSHPTRVALFCSLLFPRHTGDQSVSQHLRKV